MTPLERRLAAFVDRVSEMDRFRDMLDKREKPIMVVWGEAGLGKTSLFFRMIHECAERKLRRAEIIWTDTRNHTYLDVMCKIRDDVGVDGFRSFSELLDTTADQPLALKIEVETTGPFNVGGSSNFRDAQFRDMTGVNIKNPTFVMPTLPMADRAVLESSRMNKLTDRFLKDLSQTLKQDSLVVFFDGVEKMKDDCYKWVWGELLRAAADGRLDNITFVLCGRTQPELEPDMDFMVERAQLQPLGQEDILEYLTKRREAKNLTAVIDDRLLIGMSYGLLEGTDGRPDVIATKVDAMLMKFKTGVPGG